MTDVKVSPLTGETLVTLPEAAKDFGGVTISLATLKKYLYTGLAGHKLESIKINRRYTSKEAIQRFITQQQNNDIVSTPPKVKPLTSAQIEAGLRRYGIIK